MQYCNIGRYYDLIYVITKYFKSGEVKNLSGKQEFDFSCIPDCLLPFFYKEGRQYSIMDVLLQENAHSLLLNDDINVLIDMIKNSEIMVDRLMEFYFGANSSKVSLDGKLKRYMYAFFVDPDKTINILIQAILMISLQVWKIYGKKEKNLVEMKSKFEENAVLHVANQILDKEKITLYSFSLFNTEVITTIQLKDETILILGQNYIEQMGVAHQIDFKELGNVIAEPNRMKLLDMLREKERPQSKK